MRKIFAALMIFVCVIFIFPPDTFAAMSDENFLTLCYRNSTPAEVEAAIKRH